MKLLSFLRNPYIMLIVTLALTVVVIATSFLVPKAPKTPSLITSPSPVPTKYPLLKSVNPPEMKSLPSGKQGGVDIESDPIKNSQLEIEKLNPSLPFEETLRLESGEEVTILIPSPSLQINPWTLTVQIFGLDYQIPEDDSNYELIKESFLEASANAFGWINSKGANPEKIIISWGDKAFIQESAEKWLKTQ